jgi:hypothetical protein
VELRPPGRWLASPKLGAGFSVLGAGVFNPINSSNPTNPINSINPSPVSRTGGESTENDLVGFHVTPKT